jgi:hypothetical protein
MTYHEEQIYDEFWQALKDQAHSADKQVFNVSTPDEGHRQVAVTLKTPKTTSAIAKRIEVMPLSRNATTIEVRGDIDMDFEFDLNDDDLIIGLKHDGKPVATLREAAEKVLEPLFRMAREA